MTPRIWLVSDTHFNHEKLVEWGDRDKNFMETIADNLHREVDTHDTLIHLGDVCIGADQEWHDKVFKPMDCIKILVRGNHDHKSDTWYKNNGWDFVSEAIVNTWFGKRCILTHQPIPVEVLPANTVNIHGHLHNRIQGQFSPNHLLVSMERQGLRPILLRNLLNV